MTQVIEVAVNKHKAAIIDDAFDDVVELDAPFKKFQKFYQRNEEDFNRIIAAIGWEMPDLYDLANEPEQYRQFLEKVWNGRKDNIELGIIIDHPDFFQDKLANLKELEELCANLREQEIDIETFKSYVPSPESFKDNNFSYIFIDYNLGVTPGADARRRAREVAMAIYGGYPEGQKPMTILMSNDPNIVAKREEFKDNAGLLEGVFRVSPKGDLTNKVKVSLLAKAYQEAIQSNGALQAYIDTLIKASKDAQGKFEKEVRALSIDDYSFIQDSRLIKQQQPLGDYLAWLYGSLWLNLLLTDKKLRPTQKQLDEIAVLKAPMHDSLPSKKLAEIFTVALFESDLDEINYHAWEGKTKGIAKLKHLHLGDIFTIPKSKEVFMVLNPQCDLERPTDDKYLQSIFLIPGKLELFNDKVTSSPIRTELFNFENKRYRINWHLKQVKTIPLNRFERWAKVCKLQRHHRLRLNYALEIQQKFTSHMSRVGLPVAPPLTDNVKIELFFKDWKKDAKYESLWHSEDMAVISITADNKHTVKPTLNFGLDLKVSISSKLQYNEGELKLEGDNKSTLLEKRIKTLSEFINKFNNWFFDKKEFSLPADGVAQWLENGVIAVSYNLAELPANFNTAPFWLNIGVKEEL